MPWALVRLALSSTARLAVVPAQDLLELDSGSRMNTPGTDEGNWAWRAEPGAFDPAVAERLRTLVSEAAPVGQLSCSSYGTGSRMTSVSTQQRAGTPYRDITHY